MLHLKTRAEPLALPLSSLTDLEVSRGKKLGLTTGVIGGACVGVAIGTIYWLADRHPVPSHDIWGQEIAPEAEPAEFGTYVAIGAAAGAALGALSAVLSPERWEEVPLDRLRVSIAPQPRGALAFGVRVSL
jgi:hypothetical protein